MKMNIASQIYVTIQIHWEALTRANANENAKSAGACSKEKERLQDCSADNALL